MKDFAHEYLKSLRIRDGIELSGLKIKVESGELLKKFFEWREKMWKERIQLEGRHDFKDPGVYKNPEVYGYRYRNLDVVRAQKKVEL